MITIEVEFQYRTPLGLADCKRSYDVFGHFLDDDTVQEVVDWCKKAWSMKTIYYPTITFTHSNNTPYGRSTSRVCNFYGSVFMVKWDKSNIGEKTEDINVTARTFRKLYTECANEYLAWREGEAV